MILERLEPRRLFHSFTLSNGLLTMIAHPESDTLGLRIIGDNYIASLDEEGVADPFPVSQVTSVLIQALGGDDTVNINPDVTVPVTIQGGDGVDTIFAGAGPTLMEGQAGDDLLTDGPGADTMRGGDGNDTADYSARSDKLQLSLNDLADDGSLAEHDNLESDIETVMGGSGNDRIRGSPGDNVLMGNGDKDTLFGDLGDDTLSGGSQSDLLDGGGGADLLVGSAGLLDTVDYSQRTANLSITFDSQNNDGEASEHDSVSNSVECVRCGTGNDFVHGSGRANQISGNIGKDTIYGGGGNDTLMGGPGSDRIFGEGGNDFINVRHHGIDRVSGGSGIDSVLADAGDVVDSVP